MITIGKLNGIVMSSKFREFNSKPQEGKPSKTFKLNEITFFAPEINITGILRDWNLTIPADSLRVGDSILVCYNKCGPTKGMEGIFDFTGFPMVVKGK